MDRVPFQLPLSLSRAALAACAALLLGGNAQADCLSGVGSTGLSVGALTASATTPAATPPTDFKSELCEPQSASQAAGSFATASAKSSVRGSQNGMSADAIVSVSGEAFGSSNASGAGSTRIVFEVQSGPGYAGPSTISLPIDVARYSFAFTQLTGSTAVAGGTSTAELTISELGGPPTQLALIADGAPIGTSFEVVTPSASVDVDTLYVLTVSINVNAQASASQPNQDIQFATSSRAAALTLEVDESGLDPDLSVVFPLTSSLGLPPPQVSGPPVPIGPGVAPMVVAVLGAAGWWRLRRSA